jgi:hypothetical protein
MAVTKLETKTVSEPNKTTDAIISIAEVVFGFRNTKKPTLRECAWVAGRAANLLKLGEEKEAVENTSAVAIARKYQIIA